MPEANINISRVFALKLTVGAVLKKRYFIHML
jgi:hypothetical protein